MQFSYAPGDASDSPQNISMWTPYEIIKNRKPDFLVEYCFISYKDGGRIQRPSQGYRSDLYYEDEDMQKDGIYMVWPEFLDKEGNVILDEEVMIPKSGNAYMWILLFEKMWDYHRRRAIPGRLCWFMEGNKKVAEARIIEQIGLAHQVNYPVWKTDNEAEG